MILLLDTSTPLAKLTLINDGERTDFEWQADRQLAKGLLRWLEQCMGESGKSWTDMKGLGAYRGPGSFTGIRIGLTVMNTLADSLFVPIVGSIENDWQTDVLSRLNSGENDHIALPYYDRDANITTQRK